MSAQEEEVIAALADFDLERTDALVYISLLQTGSATVNTISTKLGIDKGKTYRSLHKMQNLGLVSATFSNPTVCNAIDPEKALISIIQRKEEQVLSMQKTLKKITNAIMQFKNPHEEASQIPSFYVIQGRPNIYTRIGNVLEESTKKVYIVTTAQDLIRMSYTAIPEKIRACKKNRGQVRIITDADNNKLFDGIREFSDAEIKICPLPSKSRMVVSQEKRLLMSGAMNDSMSLNDEVDSTLYTNSREIIANMYNYCTHLWNVSKELEEAKSEMIK